MFTMTNNKFDVPGAIASTLFVLVIGYFLWPICSGSVCHGILWGSNPQEDFSSLILFSPFFLAVFIASSIGLVKYALGYGLDKNTQKTSSKKKPKYKILTRKDLLYSSMFWFVASTGLFIILIWDLVLLNKMM